MKIAGDQWCLTAGAMTVITGITIYARFVVMNIAVPELIKPFSNKPFPISVERLISLTNQGFLII